MALTPPSLEPVFEALFALLQDVTFVPLGVSGLTGWGDSSRRVKHFNDVEKELQPAAYQAEHRTGWQPRDRLGAPARRLVTVNWIIYFRTDGGQIGSQIASSTIMPAINAVLVPDDLERNVLTLGGLAYYTRIEGDEWLESGDLDDQAMLVVPLSLLIP